MKSPVEHVEAARPMVAALERLGVPYYIGGSVASIAFGNIRSTADVDFVAGLELKHAAPLVEQLGGVFYADEESIRIAVRRRDSFNVIYLPLMFKVDVFIPKLRAFDHSAMRRKRREQIDPEDPTTRFEVASAEDIILHKLEWFRLGGEVSERQWLDLQAVLKVQAGKLDESYLDQWAHEIGVADLLARARGDAAI